MKKTHLLITFFASLIALAQPLTAVGEDYWAIPRNTTSEFKTEIYYIKTNESNTAKFYVYKKNNPDASGAFGSFPSDYELYDNDYTNGYDYIEANTSTGGDQEVLKKQNVFIYFGNSDPVYIMPSTTGTIWGWSTYYLYCIAIGELAGSQENAATLHLRVAPDAPTDPVIKRGEGLETENSILLNAYRGCLFQVRRYCSLKVNDEDDHYTLPTGRKMIFDGGAILNFDNANKTLTPDGNNTTMGGTTLRVIGELKMNHAVIRNTYGGYASTSNYLGSYGGGIYCYAAASHLPATRPTLELTDVEFYHCMGANGPTMAFAANDNHDVTLTNVTVHECYANDASNGGVIRALAAANTSMSIYGCEFYNNRSNAAGGAVMWGCPEPLTIMGNGNIPTKIHDNIGGRGGALALYGSATIRDTEIYDNQAIGGGSDYLNGRGGGIVVKSVNSNNVYSPAYNITIQSGVEISGNSAQVEGGGLYIWMDPTYSIGYASATTPQDVEYQLNMTGGKIHGNTAPKGGGIAIIDECANKNMRRNNVWSGQISRSVNISGGEIYGNTCTEDGAGIYISKRKATWNTSTYDCFQSYSNANWNLTYTTTPSQTQLKKLLEALNYAGGAGNITVNISGGEIHNNTNTGTGTGNGGGLYIANKWYDYYNYFINHLSDLNITIPDGQTPAQAFDAWLTTQGYSSVSTLMGLCTVIINKSGTTAPKIEDNEINGDGGGIYIDHGDFYMDAGLISGNKANGSGGSGGDGGGVYVSAGEVRFNNSETSSSLPEISGNTAARHGGGLYNGDGTVTVYGSYSSGTASHVTISNNTATGGSGGGIFCMGNSTSTVDDPNLILRRVTLSGNKASGSGTSTVNGATVSNGCGGGVYLQQGVITLTNSTLSGNEANVNGGGINNHEGGIYVKGSTIGGATDALGNKATTGSGGGIYTNAGNIFINHWANAIQNEESATIISHNTANVNGGGINTHLGEVEIYGNGKDSPVVVSHNEATTGSGGGIFCMGRDGDLTTTYITAKHVNLINNKALGNGTTSGISNGCGGGMYLQHGEIDVTNVTMQNNYAQVNGGAINNHQGFVDVWGCIIGGSDYYVDNLTDGGTGKGNKAVQHGGGIYTNEGNIDIEDRVETDNGQLVRYESQVTHNEAGQNGGGINTHSGTITINDDEDDDQIEIAHNKANKGGGMYANAGTIKAHNARIHDNTATLNGGAVNNHAGDIILYGGSLSNNTAEQGHGGGAYTYVGDIDLFQFPKTKLENVTLNDGTKVYNNIALKNGGAFNNHTGRVDVRHATLYNNTASQGNGGGIFCEGPHANANRGLGFTIRLLCSDLVQNKTRGQDGTATDPTGRGGGVYLKYGSLYAHYSNILDNSATISGGGIDNHEGQILLYGCDVIGNKALGERGGGIFVKQGDITTGPSAVRETGSETPSKATLVQSNTAHIDGGGIYNEQGNINLNGDLVGGDDASLGNIAQTGDGGGVYIKDGTINMKGGKIAHNTANDGKGGGVYSGGGTFNIEKRDDNPLPIVIIVDAEVETDSVTIHYHLVDQGKYGTGVSNVKHGIYWGTDNPPTTEVIYDVTTGYTYTQGEPACQRISIPKSEYNEETEYNVQAFYRYTYGGNTYTGKSEVTQILTYGDAPLVVSGAVSNITNISATGSGKLMYAGSSAITIDKRGVQVWTGDTTPDDGDNLHPSSESTEFFSVDLNSLDASTTYHARAYVSYIKNSTTYYAYGATVDFTTRKSTPDMSSGTLSVSDITSNSAKFDFSPMATTGLTAYGFVVSTDDDPELHADHTIACAPGENFTATATDLEEGTAYYVRAYASTVTSPGTDITNYTLTDPVRFFTLYADGKPVVRAIRISNITQTSATITCQIFSGYEAGTTTYGVHLENDDSYHPSTNYDSSTGTYTVNLTGLSVNTTYYLKAYATNDDGANYSYGNGYNFTTLPIVQPNVVITSVSDIAKTSAKVNFTIDDGGGEITAKGVIYSTSPDMTSPVTITNISVSGNVYTANLSGLIAHTTYYVRAYATNSAGTHTCQKVSFQTDYDKPTVALESPYFSYDKTTGQHTIYAKVTPHTAKDGEVPVKTYGVCWSASNIALPTRRTFDATDDGYAETTNANVTSETPYTQTPASLKYPNTKYYVRAYASTNNSTSSGLDDIVYSEENPVMTFLTLPPVQTGVATNLSNDGATMHGTIACRDDNDYLYDANAATNHHGVVGFIYTKQTSGNLYLGDVDNTNVFKTEAAVPQGNYGATHAFEASVTGLGLANNQEVRYRAYCTNTEGNTAYGDIETFAAYPYSITFSIEPSGAGIASANPGGLNAAGEQTVITATPNDGYAFNQWTIDNTTYSGTGSFNNSSEATTTFTMGDPAANVGIKANFAALEHTLTLKIMVGDVEFTTQDYRNYHFEINDYYYYNDNTINLSTGEQITILVGKSVINDEYERPVCFDQWSVTGSGSSVTNSHQLPDYIGFEECTFTMGSEDATLTAYFLGDSNITLQIVNQADQPMNTNNWTIRGLLPGEWKEYHSGDVIEDLACNTLISSLYLKDKPNDSTGYDIREFTGTPTIYAYRKSVNHWFVYHNGHNTTLTAIVAPTHKLTIIRPTNNSYYLKFYSYEIKYNTTGQNEFNIVEGGQYSIKAYLTNGYTFDHWDGTNVTIGTTTIEGNTVTTTFTMGNADATITAVFTTGSKGDGVSAPSTGSGTEGSGSNGQEVGPSTGSGASGTRPRDIYPAPAREPWDWDDMEGDTLPQRATTTITAPQDLPMIDHNSAEYGGGIYMTNDDPANPTRLVFSGGSNSDSQGKIMYNYASEAGGGIYIDEKAYMQMKGHCVVNGNHVPAGHEGGGILLDGRLYVGETGHGVGTDGLIVNQNFAMDGFTETGASGYVDHEADYTTTNKDSLNNVFLKRHAYDFANTSSSDHDDDANVITLLCDLVGAPSSKTETTTTIGFHVSHGFCPVIATSDGFGNDYKITWQGNGITGSDYYSDNEPMYETWLSNLMSASINPLTGTFASNSAIFEDTESYIAIHTNSPNDPFHSKYIYLWGCWTHPAVINDPETGSPMDGSTDHQGHYKITNPTDNTNDDNNYNPLHWEIYSEEGLAWFSAYVNGLNAFKDGDEEGHYVYNANKNPYATAKLMNDLDMSKYYWVPIGSVTQFNGADAENIAAGTIFTDENDHHFKGTIDGQGHTIKGIECENISGIYQNGLVGYLDGGTVKNVFIDDALLVAHNSTEKGYYLGAVAGTMENGGTISAVEARPNIDVTKAVGNKDKSYVGGLVGEVKGGTLHSSMAMPEITGTVDHIGGLVGKNSGNLYNSFSNPIFPNATTSPFYAMSTGKYIGGLVGENAGTVENCYSRLQGSEPTSDGSTNVFGWFAGTNSGTIKYCYLPTEKTNYVGTGTGTLSGHGTYAATTRVSGKYGFMHRDQAVTKVNSSETNDYINNDTLIGGLQRAMNAWVADKGATTPNTYHPWMRTMASTINDDLPILNFKQWTVSKDAAVESPLYNAVGAKDGIYMDYTLDVNDLLTEYVALDQATYPTPAIYLYNTNPTDITQTNIGTTHDNVMLAINEDVGITVSGTASTTGLNARVGVTFDNSKADASLWGAAYDWHMFSPALNNVPMGLTYHGDLSSGEYHVWDNYSTYLSNGVPEDHYYNHPEFDPPQTTWNTAEGHIGYFPTDTPYGPWRSGGDITQGFDFYCYSEPYYHWINFKRKGVSDFYDHWRENATDDGRHLNIRYENEEQMVNGKGYMMAVSQASMLMADGTLNNGDINAPKATFTTENYFTDYDVLIRGSNLIGNPYQSYLDFDEFAKDGGENNGKILNKAYYVVDADKTGYIAYPEDGSLNSEYAPQYIHPHQGFFVKVSSTQELKFTNAMRVAGNWNNGGGLQYSSFRGERLNYPLVNLICYDSGGKRDLTTVEVHRPEVGGAYKMHGLRMGTALLYANFEGQGYQALFAPAGTKEVPVRLEVFEDGVFTMKWSMFNGDFHYVHLIDNLTGADIDLLNAEEYRFEGRTSDYTSRFRLVFSVTGLDDDEPTTGHGTFAFQHGDELIVTGEGTLQMFDLNGRCLLSTQTEGAQSSVGLPKVAAGVYLLRLTGSQQSQVQKMIVK